MIQLKKGENYSKKVKTIELENLNLSENIYSNEHVDWHYHENFYFVYLLHGQLYETNRKESYTLNPGTLLFHNWQDAHFNINKNEISKGFHMEIEPAWFEGTMINPSIIEGSLRVEDPMQVILFDKIYQEAKILDCTSDISINTLLVRLFGDLLKMNEISSRKTPNWVPIIKNILHDEDERKLSLKYLSDELNIHPVHLSNDFSKYFNQMTIGDYIRSIKINRAITLLKKGSLSVTEISYICHFSDQSHFIRIFRKYMGITPLQYMKICKK
jgi:AraC family transcriptional regulator